MKRVNYCDWSGCRDMVDFGIVMMPGEVFFYLLGVVVTILGGVVVFNLSSILGEENSRSKNATEQLFKGLGDLSAQALNKPVLHGALSQDDTMQYAQEQSAKIRDLTEIVEAQRELAEQMVATERARLEAEFLKEKSGKS